MDIKKTVDEMSIEQLCSQVLVGTLSNKDVDEKSIEMINREKPGALYADQLERKVSKEELYAKFDFDKRMQKTASEIAGFPCMMTTDVEYGPGSYCWDLPEMPNPMAWGACNDEKMIERAGELTGRIIRKAGVHHILAPVVDLNLNFQNALVSIRSISDNPDRVIKIAGAYIRGVQKNGYLGACLKHFPGDGVDDRNQHFLTTENSLSEKEWMDSYGKVYKALIEEGVSSVMVGHISCPAFQEGEIDECGALPATVSKKLITGLLKGRLGFKGCVISDAMSMIGVCARLSTEELGIAFFNAGGDLMLFPEKGEKERLVNAVKTGVIPLERMKDAAYRVLELKRKLRLFENTDIDGEIGDISGDIQELDRLGKEISDRAVKTVRNFDGVLPVKIEKGKILMINLTGHYLNEPVTGTEFADMEDEFKKYGWEVSSRFDPKHREIERDMNDYDLVVVTTKCNYHGGTMRMGWNNLMSLWRGLVLHHKRIVFVSLDDPYKLYDFPYARTYINTFGDSGCSQRSAVKLILGKIKEQSKNPVSFKGYFEREDF